MKRNEKLFVFTLILIATATVCKYFFGPNLAWSGFSPVIAIALFSGFIFKQKNSSFLLPLIALFASDVIIHILYTQQLFPYPGFYGGQWINYLILLSATLIGWLLKGRTIATLFAGALVAPTVFFLISNFNVWLGTSEVMYSKDGAGLIKCYTAALPFYKNALIATMFFVPSIAIVYNLLTRNKTALKLAA